MADSRAAAHLLRTVGERTINRKVVECLVRAGAFDSIHPDRGALLGGLDRLVDQAARQRQALEVGQGFLFALDEEEAKPHRRRRPPPVSTGGDPAR